MKEVNKKNEGMYSRKIGEGSKTQVVDEGNSVYRALSVNRIKWLDIFLDMVKEPMYGMLGKDEGTHGRIFN